MNAGGNSHHNRPILRSRMYAGLSRLPAFILNGLLDHQNASTDHYTACPLAGVLSQFCPQELKAGRSIGGNEGHRTTIFSMSRTYIERMA